MIIEILKPLVSPRFQSEERYRLGHIRIINAVPGRRILGIHVPEMKAVAKQIANSENAEEFLLGFEREFANDRFSLCYEETVVWGLVINAMKCSVEQRLNWLRRFVPVIDNWGVCDTFCCNTKWAKRVPEEELWTFLQSYFDSEKEFEVRFAVVMSMCHLLKEEWLERVFSRLEKIDFSKIRSEYVSHKEAESSTKDKGVVFGSPPYYVRMAVAWCLATSLAKFPEETRSFVRSSVLPDDVKRLYQRKAKESFRTRDVVAM